MTLITGAAIYFVVWWLCLFVVLPFGVRTQDEEGTTIRGTAPSAPVRPLIFRKALITSGLAAIVVALLWLASEKFGLSLEWTSRIFE